MCYNVMMLVGGWFGGGRVVYANASGGARGWWWFRMRGCMCMWTMAGGLAHTNLKKYKRYGQQNNNRTTEQKNTKNEQKSLKKRGFKRGCSTKYLLQGRRCPNERIPTVGDNQRKQHVRPIADIRVRILTEYAHLLPIRLNIQKQINEKKGQYTLLGGPPGFWFSLRF